MINKIAKFFRSDIFNKLFCFLIMSGTWFISWFFCSLLLDITVIKMVNFYVLKRFNALDTCGLFVFFYPLCIICYYVLSLIGKKNTLIEKWRFNIFIVVVTLMSIVLYITLMEHPSHKAFVILLSFVMSIVAYMKIYCIDKSKYKTFAIISIGEIVGIPAIFEIEKLIKHLL